MTDLKKKIIQEESLPYSFFAEQAILNIFLTNGNNKNLIKNNIGNLKKNSFYSEFHRLIFEAIIDLWEKNSSINITTILSKLQDNGTLKKIGGIEKIISIINHYENISDLEEYIRIVNEKYIRRLIIELGKQSIRWGYSTSLNINQILEKIENFLTILNQQRLGEKIQSAAEIVEEIYEDLKTKKINNYGAGFTTSFKDFDAIIQGFQKSDLIVIAGRPSMGKTAFSLNIAKNIIQKYDIPLIFFTLEMSRQQIIYRLIASESKISNNRVQSGKMTLEELNNLKKTMTLISKMPIFIDDNSNLTLSDIRAKIKNIFTDKNKNGIIIIDYLQLMKLGSKLENRVQEISYLTRNLKLLAKEFNIPIILLSQLSRNVESRVNKRPILSDLRESGCIAKLNQEELKNLYSWDSKNIISPNINNFNFKGIKPTYMITLENNVKIQLTGNHKILAKKGWIRISELSNKTNIYLVEQRKTINMESKVYDLKIKNIEYQGINSVFDKCVPIYHNYLFENVLLHNSIEQDADIVIMLYREDYYNQKLSKTQVTEVIVGKHRNGPIGTARLLFNPKTTTFSNITSLNNT